MDIDYADRLTDDPSITMPPRSFPIFFFHSFFHSSFYQSPPVPLTIPAAYKGTQFPAARNCFSLFRSDTLSRLSCIFIHGASLHSPVFGRYSSLLPPVSPIPRIPQLLRSSTSVIVTEAHWTLSTMRGYRARVVDAPTLAAAQPRPLRIQRMPRIYLRARCVCFSHENAIDGRLFVDASDSALDRAVSIAAWLDSNFRMNRAEKGHVILVGNQNGWSFSAGDSECFVRYASSSQSWLSFAPRVKFARRVGLKKLFETVTLVVLNARYEYANRRI